LQQITARHPVVLTLATLLFAMPLAGQTNPARGNVPVIVNSEAEDYLRLLQVGGAAGLYPWSIRGFGPAELDRIVPADTVEHPWSDRYSFQPGGSGTGALRILAPEARFIYNSDLPYGPNEGATWAGRGLTTTLRFGVDGRMGPLSFSIAPLWFRAENADFDFQPPRRITRVVSEFADRRRPGIIDLPQRFGDQAYSRLDPGASGIRLDAGPLVAGVSTANQHWGPATTHPILLGSNAPGFLHGYAGTSRPIPVGIGRVHGRLVWGRLEQSEYSPMQDEWTSRFMSGLIGVFTPRGVDGLELGVARFFHQGWPEEGIGARDFLRPLESFLKVGLPVTGIGQDRRSNPTNQLASVFARWVLPESGFEIYGEFGREDHNWDFRDLLLQPDHDSSFMLGLTRVWRVSPDRYVSASAEHLNARISHLVNVREQVPFYIHTRLRQGHTHRGQLLGSASGFSGAGSVAEVKVHHRGGMWGVGGIHSLVRSRGELDNQWVSYPVGDEVLAGVRGEGLFFLGRFDLSGSVTAARHMNRQNQPDLWNLSATLGGRWVP
jgi:hypothetical protein